MSVFIAALPFTPEKFPQWLADTFSGLEYKVGEAMHRACERGRLKTAKWLHAHYPEQVANSGANAKFKHACSNGHLDLVQWMHAEFGKGMTTTEMEAVAPRSVGQPSVALHSRSCPDAASGFRGAPSRVRSLRLSVGDMRYGMEMARLYDQHEIIAYLMPFIDAKCASPSIGKIYNYCSDWPFEVLGVRLDGPELILECRSLYAACKEEDGSSGREDICIAPYLRLGNSQYPAIKSEIEIDMEVWGKLVGRVLVFDELEGNNNLEFVERMPDGRCVYRLGGFEENEYTFVVKHFSEYEVLGVQ